MFSALHYPANGGRPTECQRTDIAQRVNSRDGVLWVDITEPSEEDFATLANDFHFHPLAIEDLKQPDQRPKAIEYDQYVFVVMHELRPSEGREDLSGPCVERGAEIHCFVGGGYIVTVRNSDSVTVKSARKRWEGMQDLHKQGPFLFLYLLLDTLVDDYFPALDAFDERIDTLEQLVLSPANEEVSVVDNSQSNQSGQKTLRTLLDLRRDMLEMRRYVAPLRDAVNILLRRVESHQDDHEGNGIRAERSRALFAYFQDVYDHTIRVVDTIDTYRDLLSGTLDAHLAVASNRLNEIVKVLTSVSIILMTWATISGIYGMNFTNMPELHWRHGYYYALGLMAAFGILEWIYFRRRKWL